MNNILPYIAGLLPIVWGIPHLIVTRKVVKGFEPVSTDNRHVIRMEWINEGITLLFIGALVIIATVVAPNTTGANVVYWTSAAALVALSVVSYYTGFKVNYLPYKLCIPIFMTSAILLILGISR